MVGRSPVSSGYPRELAGLDGRFLRVGAGQPDALDVRMADAVAEVAVMAALFFVLGLKLLGDGISILTS